MAKSKAKKLSLDERLDTQFNFDGYHKPSTHMVYKDVEVKKGNKIYKTTQIVEIDPRENLADYTVDMFDLANLIAIGAEKTLVYGTVSDNRIDTFITTVTSMDLSEE